MFAEESYLLSRLEHVWASVWETEHACWTGVRELSLVKASLIFKLAVYSYHTPGWLLSHRKHTHTFGRTRSKPSGASTCHKSHSRCQGHRALAIVTDGGRETDTLQDGTEKRERGSVAVQYLSFHVTPCTTCFSQRIKTIPINPIWILIRAKEEGANGCDGWKRRDETGRRRRREGGDSDSMERRRRQWGMMGEDAVRRRRRREMVINCFEL